MKFNIDNNTDCGQDSNVKVSTDQLKRMITLLTFISW